MAKEMYCANCGTVGKPNKVTKGSLLIEIVLWLFMILPGLLYSLWRLSTRYQACPQCEAPNMIPADSPKARAALGQRVA
jgi:hypothetical protein